MANSVDPDQTVPIGAVCSGSTLFTSILNLSVMLGNYLQRMTSADNIFGCIFFLGTLKVKAPAKKSVTENVVCLSHLLHIFDNISGLSKYRGKQSDLDLFNYAVCRRGFYDILL